MTLVSVIMPVFNSEKYLAQAIESILTQTFSDFELIIVDDGSTDGSADIIRAYAERDARIRAQRFAENKGVAIARNHGNALAKGKYITGMDSDDICLPERLQKQVDFLESHPEVGAVGVHAHVVTADLQQILDRETPQHHALILLDHYIGDPFVHASVMLRRHLLLEAGGIDVSMTYSSDTELMTRLMDKTRFANIPDCLYLYRRHGAQNTSRPTEIRDQFLHEMRVRRLEKLWGEVPDDTLDRFSRIKPWFKLSWRERRAAKRDIKRLIDAMIAAQWIEPGDRPPLIATMNRKLERASPRLWQQLCHWRRHRLGWLQL